MNARSDKQAVSSFLVLLIELYIYAAWTESVRPWVKELGPWESTWNKLVLGLWRLLGTSHVEVASGNIVELVELYKKAAGTDLVRTKTGSLGPG